jgi:hypothetical protein
MLPLGRLPRDEHQCKDGQQAHHIAKLRMLATLGNLT